MRTFALAALLAVLLCCAPVRGDGLGCEAQAYLGSVMTPGEARDVRVVGAKAYVAGDDAGLLIYDVSDPGSVTLLGQYDTPGRAQSLEVFANESVVRVYVADRDGGVRIVTATDPTSPTLWAAIPVADARDVALRPGAAPGSLRLSVAAGAGGLVEYRVISVFSITQVESEPTSGSAVAVEAQTVDGQDYIYVASSRGGVDIFAEGGDDASDLLVTLPASGSVSDLEVRGDVLYAASGSRGVDVFTLAPDRSGGSLEDNLTLPSPAMSLRVDGDRMYVGSGQSDLHIADVSDPASPGYLGSARVPGVARSCDATGGAPAGVAWVASGDFGLLGLDTSEPSVFGDGALLGTYAWTDGNVSNPHRTAVWDGLALAPRFVLEVLDIGADAPALLASVDPGDYVTGADLRDQLACYTAGSRMHLLDMSDPAAPAPLGSITLSDPADVRLAQLGSTLYALVADGAAGLRVIDVSDPMAPALVGTYASGEEIERVAHVGASLFGDTAYVFQGDALTLISLIIPASPAAISSHHTGGRRPAGLVVRADRALLASVSEADHGLLEVIDISQPLTPTLVSVTPLHGERSFDFGVLELATHKDMLLVGDSRGGLSLYDLVDPAAPAFAGASGATLGVMSVSVAGDAALVRTGGALHKVDLGGCASACPADLTGDGLLNFFDVSAFLSAFSAGDPVADFTGDGSLNFFDVSAFLGAFGAGCP